MQSVCTSQADDKRLPRPVSVSVSKEGNRRLWMACPAFRDGMHLIAEKRSMNPGVKLKKDEFVSD